jgi:hypothetical protein
MFGRAASEEASNDNLTLNDKTKYQKLARLGE